jgi:hypothetical protein
MIVSLKAPGMNRVVWVTQLLWSAWVLLVNGEVEIDFVNECSPHPNVELRGCALLRSPA